MLRHLNLPSLLSLMLQQEKSYPQKRLFRIL